MSSFINKIVTRHLYPIQNVKPRLRGRFEGMEQTFGQIRAYDGSGHPETITKNQEKTNVNLSGITNKRDVNEHASDDQPDFAIEGHSEIEPAKNNDLYFKGKIEKPSFREGSETKIPDNGTLIPEQSNPDQDREFSLKPGHFHSDNPQLISFDVTPELIRKNQDFTDFQSGRHPLNKPDSSMTDNSNSTQFAAEEGTENDQSHLSKLNEDKLESGPFDRSRKNSLIGSYENDNIPDFKKFFEPNFKTPDSQVIKVSIGRINVRAEVPKATPVIRRKQTQKKPKMSLDDYLKKQKDLSR